MLHQWYADSRDLIKWGVLLHLAKSSNSERIIQVAYLRQDAFRPVIERQNEQQNEEIQLPEIVWAHFRNLRHIERLAKAARLEIVLIDTPYQPVTRSEYSKTVISEYRTRPKKPTVVFLDPDTGIAEKCAKPEHVSSKEVSDIWKALEPSDWLVLYQHSHHHKDWLSIKRDEFIRAIASRPEHVEVFRAIKGAKDVAFLCAQKSQMQ
jgi:hypothetical protein